METGFNTNLPYGLPAFSDPTASCAADIRADLLDGLSPCCGDISPSMDDFYVVATEDDRVRELLLAMLTNPSVLLDTAQAMHKRLDVLMDNYAESYAPKRIKYLEG